MKHELRIGQLIRCERFKDAKLQHSYSSDAPPVLDPMRLLMNEASTLSGSWHEQLEENTYKVHSYSLDKRTDGRFGSYEFKVIAINLIASPRSMERGRAIVAEAQNGVRILFFQGDVMLSIEPAQIEWLDGPADDPVEPIW